MSAKIDWKKHFILHCSCWCSKWNSQFTHICAHRNSKRPLWIGSIENKQVSSVDECRSICDNDDYEDADGLQDSATQIL